jgi:dTDP-4-amino-4,6-dideoxygalactose transaminase
VASCSACRIRLAETGRVDKSAPVQASSDAGVRKITSLPKYPFLRPNPPKLSRLDEAVRKIERSGIFSNYGPTNHELERALLKTLFGGRGHCVTVCNATIGLILAVRAVMDRQAKRDGKKYALMPSFTFAATAHAAIWNNLVPLLCDIDPDTWQPSLVSLDDLLGRFKGEVAVLMPYATFGNNLDLSAYAELSARHKVPMVVDAAASLGSVDTDGLQFGTGFEYPLIYSMHVTKTFSTGEGGVVYCDEEDLIATLRCMGNFGFGQPKSATMPGLNSKLTEIGALLGLEKLKELEGVVARRQKLMDTYRQELPELTFQRTRGRKLAHQFIPALLPKGQNRNEVVARLAAEGITVSKYFSPHIAEQPYFRQAARFFDLGVTSDVADRIISLPIYDNMKQQDVRNISTVLCRLMASR